MQTIKLHNGVVMPVLGFGVYQVPPEETARTVTEAIEIGYRMFDTVQSYHNELGVGEAIKNSGINREEFFIVTKIWVSNAGEEKAYASILESLRKLQTDYVDLLLIHQPFGDYYGTYRAMEKAYSEGKARAIGVSNFYPDRFVDFLHFVNIQPAVNQIELHVFQQQMVARKYAEKYGAHVMSWGPFAEGKNAFFENAILMNIGKKYGKTTAQVALRFLIQEGVVAIPKSVKRERMQENFDIFDFILTEEEIATLRALDTGHSLFFSHYDPEIAETIINLRR